ncbi:hypothetical protein RIF29_14180 [Crotalaria pallida]|uniref:Uncharacterized protein n=1 Tax=Crotalaria pallida TaxID=3830 RepID=A0AAN9FBA1_CROPI
MAHLLTPAPATVALTVRARKSSLYSWKSGCFPRVYCCVGHQYQYQISSISNQDQAPPPNEDQQDQHLSCRRYLCLITHHNQDPNLSGVEAKVLTSKKRKEAMKEVAKLSAKGKTIYEEPLPASEELHPASD